MPLLCVGLCRWFVLCLFCLQAAQQLQNIVGKGSAEPVADNGTAQGRQLNRRVEIYLYASQAMVDAANAGTLK